MRLILRHALVDDDTKHAEVKLLIFIVCFILLSDMRSFIAVSVARDKRAVDSLVFEESSALLNHQVLAENLMPQ